MAKSRNKRKRGETNETYNTELIFSSAMYLLSAKQIELESIFHYELAPVPTSWFQDNSESSIEKYKMWL